MVVHQSKDQLGNTLIIQVQRLCTLCLHLVPTSGSKFVVVICWFCQKSPRLGVLLVVLTLQKHASTEEAACQSHHRYFNVGMITYSKLRNIPSRQYRLQYVCGCLGLGILCSTFLKLPSPCFC